jgi:DNA-binding FadR family transcriptional regulator
VLVQQLLALIRSEAVKPGDRQSLADPQVRRHERLLAVISSSDLDAVMREIGEHGNRAFLNELAAPPAEREGQPGSTAAARKP